MSRLPGNVLTTDAFETVKSRTAKSVPLVTYWYRAASPSSLCMPAIDVEVQCMHASRVGNLPHQLKMQTVGQCADVTSLTLSTRITWFFLQHCRLKEWQVC